MAVPVMFRRIESIPGLFVHGGKEPPFHNCIAPFNDESRAQERSSPGARREGAFASHRKP
jgi:hypothetical protein